MEHKTARLKKLRQLGQSPWYDNIDRRLLENGELKGLISRGIVGVTSNPTIFEKAVAGSDVYDEKIKRLKREGKDLAYIYDELTADDVRDASDLLKGVYESTAGQDGYVSIEVLPKYARDPSKTFQYAKEIYRKVGRRNIMIKVPATPESAPAIRAIIAEGISVNATLIFSEKQYELAALAYQEGLRQRMKLGADIKKISSVASVFVSRIDTKIDSLLDAFASREIDIEKRSAINELKGKIAVGNCKFIYQRFKKLFSEDRFGELKEKGAQLQRPLWASTSTKNPAYSDCIYVDSLIGSKTVNTMPHQTVIAFEDHGHLALSLESGLEKASEYRARIEQAGINLDEICREAQTEGLRAFENSFQSMMETLRKKMEN